MTRKSLWVCAMVLVSLAAMSGQEAHERCLVSMPTYPPLARMAHIEGQVDIQVEVDKDGNVVSAVSNPVPGEPRGIPLLRPEALKAIRGWKLSAAGASDRVPFKTSVVVDFKLVTDEKGDAHSCPRVTFDSFRRVEIVATFVPKAMDSATISPLP